MSVGFLRFFVGVVVGIFVSFLGDLVININYFVVIYGYIVDWWSLVGVWLRVFLILFCEV